MTTISKLDVMRTANILIENHGDDAEDYAHEKYMRFFNAGDVKGAAVWMGIIQDIRLLHERSKGSVH